MTIIRALHAQCEPLQLSFCCIKRKQTLHLCCKLHSFLLPSEIEALRSQCLGRKVSLGRPHLVLSPHWWPILCRGRQLCTSDDRPASTLINSNPDKYRYLNTVHLLTTKSSFTLLTITKVRISRSWNERSNLSPLIVPWCRALSVT